MRSRPTLPSPSMAVALTALFVALGGTGYAATQLHPSGDVQSAAKKHKKPASDTSTDTSLFNKLAGKLDDTSKDLTGLNAYLAVTAVPKAKHATSADAATTATTAGGAPPTGAAGGALSGTYPNPGLAALPAVSPISSFGTGASDYAEASNPAGYYKDALGIVHLTGAIQYPGGAALLFTLPAGVRFNGRFAVASGTTGATCFITLDLSGNANALGSCAGPVGIDGITYRPLG